MKFGLLKLMGGAAAAVTAGHYLARVCEHGRCQAYHDKKMHQRMSEQQIDKMVQDSFPASDPPSTY